jgi:dolichol-phosphate mannosyltransferase
MHITLVICNKNEVSTITSVIKESKKYVSEILVIDGHSTDGSENIAKRYGATVFIDEGKGKGQAIREGIRKAHGDIIVFMDADGSHNPRDISKLIKPIIEKKADLVLASRTVGGSDELNGSVEKTIRMIGSAIITQAINSRYHTRLTDTENGFRAIRTTTAKQLPLVENIFTIEQEMVMKALNSHVRIAEIPSHEFKRKFGHSHIHLVRMAGRFIWCLVRDIM